MSSSAMRQLTSSPFDGESGSLEALFSSIVVALVFVPDSAGNMTANIAFGLSGEKSCIIRMILHDIILKTLLLNQIVFGETIDWLDGLAV